MSILTRILGLGSKADARADQQRSQFIAPSRFAAHLGLGTKAGVSVSEEGAMALSAVYSCVRLIASSLAAIDLHLHRINGSQREIAADHPVYQLINSTPAEMMTAYDFWELIISDALLHGQGYALIERGEISGRPIATEMQKLAPEDTGELKKSIVVRVYKVANVASRNGKVHARVRIGPSARKGRTGGRYAHLVELGTKGGKRITRKRKFNIFGDGKVIGTREINHPGNRPQPFIRAAFDNKYAKANKRIREILMKKFDAILAEHLK